MRDIKFRVWNSSSKEYISNNFVYMSPNGELLFAPILSKPNLYKQVSDILDGENIVERWTGLKDKNDKDIYEGDICSFTSKTGKHVGTVEWLDDLAGFGLRMIKNNFLYTFSELDTMGINLDTLEVVGNIRENPEFLEEK